MDEVEMGNVVASVLNYEYENESIKENSGVFFFKNGSGRCTYDECRDEISGLLERIGTPGCDMEDLRAAMGSLAKKLSPSEIPFFSERIMDSGSRSINLDRRYGALFDTPGFASYAAGLERFFKMISEEGFGRRFKPYDKKASMELDEKRAVDQMDIQIATDSFMYLFDSALLSMSGRLVRNGKRVALQDLMREQCYRDALNDSISNHVCSKIIHDRFEYVFSTRLDHGREMFSVMEKSMRIQDDLEALIGARSDARKKEEGGPAHGVSEKNAPSDENEKDGVGTVKIPRSRSRSLRSMSR